MKKVYILFFLIAINLFGLFGRTIEKSLSVYIIEEKVNGIRFTHRSDLIDGNLKELWSIDGQSVTHELYIKNILEAEMEERRKSRFEQDKRRKQEQNFKIQAHYDILRKLIQSALVEIKKEFSKIKNPLLAPFLQFSNETIDSENSLYELENELQNAQNLCQNSDLADIQQLKEVVANLEIYPTKLEKFYQCSVNYAIKTCDNTRALKELLELIS